jgi:hypothetical protein
MDYQISYEETKTETKGHFYESGKASIQNSKLRMDISNCLEVSW